MSKIYKGNTAYTKEQALEYDDSRFTDKAGKLIHQVEMSRIYSAINRIKDGSKLIEVGCGTGRILVDIAGRGLVVDGADGSASMLEEAQRKIQQGNYQSQLFHCEANSIPVANDTYDLAYSVRLLNQTESPSYALTVIAEMLRVTKPGGFCLVEFVNHYRLRVGPNTRDATRLKPISVLNAVRENGADLVCWEGAFFLGMSSYKKSPRVLLPILSFIDRIFSRLFPRVCSRVYLVARKKG